jgi:FixJ family two-component response regulator
MILILGRCQTSWWQWSFDLKKDKKQISINRVILLTAGKISDGVQAMKNGAFDYILWKGW